MNHIESKILYRYNILHYIEVGRHFPIGHNFVHILNKYLDYYK